MEKYSLLREAVTRAGVVPPRDLRVPSAATDTDLGRVHAQGYVERVKGGRLERDEIRRIGFPWSSELVERSRRSVGGTMAAARAALDDGVAVNLAGGTHHADADQGEGFCVFNDVAVAIRAIQAEGRIGRVAVLDLDVHQGNGTASIFADDPRIFTLSVHGANNYPFEKALSDLDVELPDGTGDDAYLEAAERAMSLALEEIRPELAFYVAGADPYMHDRLGRLALTREGLARRDRLVFQRCREAGATVAVVMSGGYAREVDHTVAIHLGTVREAARWARGQVPEGRESRVESRGP